MNTGMYVVRRDRLGLIPEQARCDMTDFIEKIQAAGGRVGVSHRREMPGNRDRRMGNEKHREAVEQPLVDSALGRLFNDERGNF